MPLQREITDPFNGWDPLHGKCGVGEKSNAISGAVYRARDVLRGRDSAQVLAAMQQIEQMLQRCFDQMDLEPIRDPDGEWSEDPDRTWFTDVELLDEAVGAGLAKADPRLKGWRPHELYAVLALKAAKRAITAPPPVEFRGRGFFLGGITYEPFGEAYELVARAEMRQIQHQSRSRGGAIAGSEKALEAKAKHQPIIRRARRCIEEGWERKDIAGALANSFGFSSKQVRRVLQKHDILPKKKTDT